MHQEAKWSVGGRPWNVVVIAIWAKLHQYVRNRYDKCRVKYLLRNEMKPISCIEASKYSVQVEWGWEARLALVEYGNAKRRRPKSSAWNSIAIHRNSNNCNGKWNESKCKWRKLWSRWGCVESIEIWIRITLSAVNGSMVKAVAIF
jgi:hypothetical protein